MVLPNVTFHALYLRKIRIDLIPIGVSTCKTFLFDLCNRGIYAILLRTRKGSVVDEELIIGHGCGYI